MKVDLLHYKQTFEKIFAAFVEAHYSENTADNKNGFLHAGIRYVLAGEGKRIRALLCQLVAETCGAPGHQAWPAAIAIEMVHAYSLVHDDLPMMDNDDFRRGRPTVHKIYGDAVALLVGDALLTDSFGAIARGLPGLKNLGLLEPDLEKSGTTAENTVKMIDLLSRSAGGSGMVLGQDLDIYWTDRHGHSVSDLNKIHLHKTGKLMGAAAALGALAANMDAHKVEIFLQFGEIIGLAFQITDDLIDDLGTTGKTAGKDKAQNKLTYLKDLSRAEATALANEITQKGIQSVQSLGLPSDNLIDYARKLVDRTM